MPRNKAAKRSAKRNMTATKRNASANNHALATTQRMEQDFIAVPAKLATQLDKEVASLKQKEAKLKKALQKTKAQVKNWETRIKAATKTKHTSTGKKQLNVAKKAHAQSTKEHAGLNKELSQIEQMLEIVTNKQAKFNALSKLLKQFDKEWAKNAKAKKAKASKKAKAKRSTMRSKAKPMPEVAEEQQPHFESIETTTAIGNEIRFDETSEITS